MNRANGIVTGIATLSLFVTPPVGAQLRLSEAASVSQTIDGTTILIEYSRPRGRGRTPEQIFGQEVPWNRPWTPGANMATTIAVNRNVTLNGHVLTHGTYSIWMIPRQSGIWTVVLDPKARRYHAERPDSSDNQVRFNVQVGEGPLTPVLTWSIPRYRPDSTVITMQWSTVTVSLWLKVTPSRSAVISEAVAKPFLGRYEVACHIQIEEICSRGPGEFRKTTVSITRELGRLVARYEPQKDAPRPFYLVSIAPRLFLYGWCCSSQEGDVFAEPSAFVVFEFQLLDGNAERFEVRNQADTLIAVGVRIP